MRHYLIEHLREIVPTGKNGFEGLVAKLLGNLTGRHFHLARSGSQAGRDMRSNNHGGNIIAVECKRYGKNTELNERELLAELAEAQLNIPDLDIWVLVTSRDIPDQLFTLLEQYAVKQGLEFRTISIEDGTPSSLEVLCTHEINITLDYFTPLLSESAVKQLHDSLKSIIKISGFASILKHLQYDFEATNIGYEHWRTAQSKGLIDCFRNENKSRSTFGQALHVASEEVDLVKRSKAWQELNDWLSSWSASQAPFVLLGDEGDGKTWAVASWLDWQIQNVDNFPPAIFLSSSQPRSNEPASLLSEAIARHTGPQDQTYWEKRLMRWIQRPIGESPVIILVLDGINERRQNRGQVSF